MYLQVGQLCRPHFSVHPVQVSIIYHSKCFIHFYFFIFYFFPRSIKKKKKLISRFDNFKFLSWAEKWVVLTTLQDLQCMSKNYWCQNSFGPYLVKIALVVQIPFECLNNVHLRCESLAVSPYLVHGCWHYCEREQMLNKFIVWIWGVNVTHFDSCQANHCEQFLCIG